MYIKEEELGNSANFIKSWLISLLQKSGTRGFVVGLSGGIDSALVSTLCCMTGFPTLCVIMPCKSKKEEINRAENHIKWLEKNFENISNIKINLDDVLNSFVNSQTRSIFRSKSLSNVFLPNTLAVVNMKSRIRMVTLYSFANTFNYLVVGTGNKVEDYGLGFFTKYGDGGVDISPIGDLYKTDVYNISKYLGINEEILEAKPTDGLWEDGRTDQDQFDGFDYPDFEKEMIFIEKSPCKIPNENPVTKKYLEFHYKNSHKMEMPPICILQKYFKES